MSELTKTVELTESEKIKKYIALYKTAPEAEVKKTTKKTAISKKANHFTVDLSSGLDCVITGHSKEGDVQLILMPSQNKYLLKKDEVFQKISCEKNLLDFFHNLPKDGILVNNIVIDKITPDNVRLFYSLISLHSEELSKGLISLPVYTDYQLRRTFLDKNIDEKFKKLLVSKTPILKQSNSNIRKKYNQNFVELAYSFYHKKGFDALRMFVEEYVKSSIESVDYLRYGCGYYAYSTKTYTGTDFLNYDLDTKRVIEYICFDLYKQGFTSIPCNTYYDYLRMSFEYDNKIKDKYPAYLDTAHDVMAIKHAEAKERIDKEAFERAYKEFKQMFKSFEDISYNKIKLISPERGEDLIEEGINLGHCVGSYVNRVKNGECIILFARNSEDTEKSYLTVELRPTNNYGKLNYEIHQIQGDNKRTDLTEKEIQFFKKFAKETGVAIANRNF